MSGHSCDVKSDALEEIYHALCARKICMEYTARDFNFTMDEKVSTWSIDVNASRDWTVI